MGSVLFYACLACWGLSTVCGVIVMGLAALGQMADEWGRDRALESVKRDERNAKARLRKARQALKQEGNTDAP